MELHGTLENVEEDLREYIVNMIQSQYGVQEASARLYFDVLMKTLREFLVNNHGKSLWQVSCIGISELCICFYTKSFLQHFVDDLLQNQPLFGAGNL